MNKTFYFLGVLVIIGLAVFLAFQFEIIPGTPDETLPPPPPSQELPPPPSEILPPPSFGSPPPAGGSPPAVKPPALSKPPPPSGAKKRPPIPRVAKSTFDPPFWFFFFPHRTPCTPDKLPLPSGLDECPGGWLEPDPGMIKDYDEWLINTARWKTAADKVSTFSLGTAELKWYFEQGLEEGKTQFLDGLEDIMRRGYLNFQLYFSQKEKVNVFQFDPNNINDCCYSAYSKHYLDKDPPLFSTLDLLKQLKKFMADRAIPEDRVNFFLDIYDVVSETPFKTLKNTKSEDYAREVVKNIREIQKIIPSRVFVHEHSIWKEPLDPLPESDKPLNEAEITGHIRALAAEAKKYGAPVGIMVDAVLTDSRDEKDACRLELEEHFPFDNGLEGIQKMIPVAREVEIPIGIFIHPFADVRAEKSDACNYPKRVEDVYESYRLSAGEIVRSGIKPDFYVLASWIHYPEYALPETKKYTVTNIFLEVVKILEEQ